MKTINKFYQPVLSSMKVFRNFYFIFIAVFAMAMTADKTNFSGEWTLNNEKSTFGSEFRNAASKMKITQDAAKIVVERTGARRNGETYTYSETITLDGNECENTINQGRIRKSTAAWSADGKSLTITSTSSFEMNGETMQIKSVEVFSLADNILTVDATSTSQRGDMKNKLIYEKK